MSDDTRDFHGNDAKLVSDRSDSVSWEIGGVLTSRASGEFAEEEETVGGADGEMRETTATNADGIKFTNRKRKKYPNHQVVPNNEGNREKFSRVRQRFPM